MSVRRNGNGFRLRTKVMSVFMIACFVVLAICNYLYFLSTQRILERNAISRRLALAKTLNEQISNSFQGTEFVDSLAGHNLRTAAIAIEEALPSDASKVSNQQLVSLAQKFGLNGITLWQKKPNGDIVGVKSSLPDEIGLSSKHWGKWYVAFNQLLEPSHKVTIKFGAATNDFWVGPWTVSTAQPDKVKLFGYYDDGSTNYIINPYVLDSTISGYVKDTGPGTLAQQMKDNDPSLLDITAFNPDTFGGKPSFPIYKTVNPLKINAWVDYKNHPILFGTYKYPNTTEDVQKELEAQRTGQVVSNSELISGHKVFEIFIPVKTTGPDPVKYVIRFVSDYRPIKATLTNQLDQSLLISLVALLIVLFVSYFVSGYIVRPLTRITERVQRIAEIRFDESNHLTVHRSDEIGRLAEEVNMMSQNLSQYTQQVHRTAQEERLFGIAYVGMFTSTLIHEMRNPVSAMRTLVEMLPRVQPLDPKTDQIVTHMQTESESMHTIMEGFSSFIQSGKLDIAPYSVSDVVRSAIQAMQHTASQSRVTISLEDTTNGQLHAKIDKQKTKQVFTNLITNGIRAIADDATERSIHIRIAQFDNSYVLVDVTDTGQGIPDELYEDIFTPFRTTKKDGFGLGLALCKFIILSSGGNIFVHESSANGTVMRVVLPVVAPDVDN